MVQGCFWGALRCSWGILEAFSKQFRGTFKIFYSFYRVLPRIYVDYLKILIRVSWDPSEVLYSIFFINTFLSSLNVMSGSFLEPYSNEYKLTNGFDVGTCQVSGNHATNDAKTCCGSYPNRYLFNNQLRMKHLWHTTQQLTAGFACRRESNISLVFAWIT